MTPPFAIAFQPIVDVVSGRTLAQEALLRGPGGEPAGQVLWAVPPSRRHRFDATIRARALAEALRLGLPAIGAALALNVYPGCVGDPRHGVDRTLADAEAIGFPIDHLVFEISEAEPVPDPAALAIRLCALQRRGVRIVLDDIGTGYGRLPLLLAWRPDGAKLARELIAGLDQDDAQHRTAKAMLAELGVFGLMAVAEGVETAGEMAALRALGVRAMQGFLFARPALGRLPEVVVPGG